MTFWLQCLLWEINGLISWFRSLLFYIYIYMAPNLQCVNLHNFWILQWWWCKRDIHSVGNVLLVWILNFSRQVLCNAIFSLDFGQWQQPLLRQPRDHEQKQLYSAMSFVVSISQILCIVLFHHVYKTHTYMCMWAHQHFIVKCAWYWMTLPTVG
jgi:hypothetical protein